MGNKIIFLNISCTIFLLGARFITNSIKFILVHVNVKYYITDLNFEKIATLVSQLGSLGSDLGFHTRPVILYLLWVGFMVPHIFLWHMSFMTLIIFLVLLYSHLTSENKVHTHSSHSLNKINGSKFLKSVL